MNQRPIRPDDHRRMMLFFVLAAIIMTLSYAFITKPNMDRARAAAAARQQVAAAPAVAQATDTVETLQSLEQALAADHRVAIKGEHMQGSFSLKGLRFDDIELRDYYETLEKKNLVRLLAPNTTRQAEFVEIGLIGQNIHVPTQDTVWKVASGTALTPTTPVVLEWHNGEGLLFRRHVTMDDYYVITVKQEIVNQGDKPVTLYPYALVSQAHHIPLKGEKVSFEDRDSAVQHLGPIGYLSGELKEESYGDVKDDKEIAYKNASGWLGITGKYWLVSLLPDRNEVFDARFAYQQGSFDQDIYQADLRQQALTIAPSETKETTMRFFSGAKKLSVLTEYEKKLDVEKLDLAIDFGVLYILTKPLYHLLTFLGNYFHDTLGLAVSFGIALMVLTVLLRLATFPLQNKSYRAMNKMKDLGPKIHAIKEKYGDDKEKFQQEVMAMYKAEKVNPASGCLPILLQIPIFFALYKVIFITLDMRHAPFWGWIDDLSSPDPTTVFNLFGILPWDLPSFLLIGAWPILYGATMWIQQELNPKPEDKMQQQIFAMLPWIFTFVFAQFPAGLVIYYTWSNILGIVQQYSLRKINADIAPPKPVRKNKKKKHD